MAFSVDMMQEMHISGPLQNCPVLKLLEATLKDSYLGLQGSQIFLDGRSSGWTSTSVASFGTLARSVFSPWRLYFSACSHIHTELTISPLEFVSPPNPSSSHLLAVWRLL